MFGGEGISCHHATSISSNSHSDIICPPSSYIIPSDLAHKYPSSVIHTHHKVVPPFPSEIHTVFRFSGSISFTDTHPFIVHILHKTYDSQSQNTPVGNLQIVCLLLFGGLRSILSLCGGFAWLTWQPRDCSQKKCRKVGRTDYFEQVLQVYNLGTLGLLPYLRLLRRLSIFP